MGKELFLEADYNQVSKSPVTGKYTQSGNLSGYQIEIWHKGLNENKHISAQEMHILRRKAQSQIDKWEEKWDRIIEKRTVAQEKAESKEEAEKRTEEAQELLKKIDEILISAAHKVHVIDWENLKNREPYSREDYTKQKHIKYSKRGEPKNIDPNEVIEPVKSSLKYHPNLTWLDKLIKSWKAEKIKEKEALFTEDHNNWESKKKELRDVLEKEIKKWTEEVDEYIKEQIEQNAKIDEFKIRYLNKELYAIIEYFEMVMNRSEYPDFIEPDFEIQLNVSTGLLIVEYYLPDLEKFPTLKEVKYIASRGELKETHISESQLKKMYDKALYDITLRTIHELFESDTINVVTSIAFNGWVEFTNPATGKTEQTCILTIHANKSEFQEINIEKIDSKKCFKSLKGVSSAQLHGLTAVKPIINIDKSDRRFISSIEVADGMDTNTNLAAMDWADFEHLIREIFEKEFQVNGGEVKVTQSSKDGGVDAVAFDPDPIRGGKIVIQAKRYTNTVGVSAVRDLYGTVLNEGATKGILVTTADYGSDSYNFAKDKPLTLLNGSNLLHLLQKHGYHATIDIRAAKLLQKE